MHGRSLPAGSAWAVLGHRHPHPAARGTRAAYGRAVGSAAAHLGILMQALQRVFQFQRRPGCKAWIHNSGQTALSLSTLPIRAKLHTSGESCFLCDCTGFTRQFGGHGFDIAQVSQVAYSGGL